MAGQRNEPDVRTEFESRGPLGSIARITLDDPERLNVLGTPMLEKATAAFETIAAREDLRAVVLGGAGERAFVGGADIHEFSGFDEAAAVTFITRIHKLCDAIRRTPVPVIARIRGFCLGAGMEVAAACDLRAADRTARFGMPEVRVGVPSVIEAALLPGLIGWGRTRELLLTGDLLDAEAAARAGFLEAVTDEAGLDAKIDGWLKSILDSGPRAIRLQKRLIREWEDLPIGEAIRRGIATFGEAYRTDEPRRFTQAFFDRKKP
jgi:enoyl-CoA hydratase